MIIKRIIFLILALALLTAALVSCAPKDDTKKSSLVEPDEWVYYCTADGLYKIKENCEDKTLVMEDPPLFYSVYENLIFYMPYYEYNNTYFSIYSCKTDGSDDKLFYKTHFKSDSFKGMQVVDGWIYFAMDKEVELRKEYELYRINIDDTQMEKISQEEEILWDFRIDEDWIYYETIIRQEDKGGFQLWRMRHDGTNKQQLMDDFAMSIDYNETEIYFIDMDDGNLYAAPYFKSEKRKIAKFEEPVFDIKLIDDWIYYNNLGDNPGVYKIKTDGSENTKTPLESSVNVKKIRVVDNWLIYNADFSYIEMVRIRDTYDTDALVEYLNEETWMKFKWDGTVEKIEVEIRKYE